ncbi:dnaJ homolog subfamily C member 13 isoform X2 [Nilaparvata lugens]|nr:dnaJ homolog subfamily C member 13 isoform X2 [Nilaparvata lugens]
MTPLADNRDVACYFVNKVTLLKGRYKRIFSLGTKGITTYHNQSLEVTNRWLYSDIVGLRVIKDSPEAGQFTLLIKKGERSTDSMKFSTFHRLELFTDAFKLCSSIAEKGDSVKFNAMKHHWSDVQLPVLLEVTAVSLDQLDTATNQVLSSYCYKDIHAIQNVEDVAGGFVVISKNFHRMHLFASFDRNIIHQKMKEMAEVNLELEINFVESRITLDDFRERRLGKYSDDEHITSVCEFTVHKKVKYRSEGLLERKLCLSQSCLVERDHQSYNVVTLRPLNSITALIRDPDNPQLFTIEYNDNTSRSYLATHRDSLLATLLDGVRASKNRDVHVKMCATDRSKFIVPFGQQQDEEIESLHLKLLRGPGDNISFGEAMERFNTNVPYSGLKYSVTAERRFAANKEKPINLTLESMIKKDCDPANMSLLDLEAFFQVLHRLVASKVGFSAFTQLQNFRQTIGVKVVKSLKRDNEAITHAAIDMVCALMQPMHDDCDLRQEQLNKSSLLSNEGFLQSLLDMWIGHVNRGTGALVVTAMLDFLTFALCVPYSETTDGKQFDVLLEMVAKKGRDLFKLFEHKSLTIVKGAGLVMRAVIEEGSEGVAARMQELALSEGALLRHLLTALFTADTDQRMLVNRQLSRHLVGLWVSGNETALSLLQRIMPSSLLDFLNLDEEVSDTVSIGEDALNFRDNLKLAQDQAIRDRQNPHIVAVQKQIKILEKQIESTLEHWGMPFKLERPDDTHSKAPIVLRKRRERIKSVDNWKLFYHRFFEDHARSNLIWDHKTREELREALKKEVKMFVSDRELSGNTLIAWNHGEFEVHYNCLAGEVFIDGYYLRLLLEENSTDCVIKNVNYFFNSLYHRFLLTRLEMRPMVLQAMAIVYDKYFKEIGPFGDTKYIVGMLERCIDRKERDRFLQFLDKLMHDKKNVKAVIDANGVQIFVDLMTLAHLHTSRAVAPTQTNVIEAGKDMVREAEKEWYYGTGGEKKGPVSFLKMKELWQRGEINGQTKCWAQKMERWMPLQAIPQLKWCLAAKSEPVMNESELASLILSMLIKMCEFYKSRDSNGAVIWPMPRIKRELSDPNCLPHIVQLLLTFDPVLVEKVATLLCHIAEDNALVSKLYDTGVFYFIMMYRGSNLLPIARFLKLTHTKQAFKLSDEDHSSELMQRSVLGQLLPEAMIYYLENHGPNQFTKIFLGEFDTPEAIWNSEMRRFLAEKIAYHIADFTPKLRGNNRLTYNYCSIPVVRYPQLENEFFCNIFYLRHLCDTTKFPNWPIEHPVNLLKDTLEAWQGEVEKKPPAMSVDEAYEALELEPGQHHDPSVVRKAYYKLAQKYHPDKNPGGRDKFLLMKASYEFLCSRSSFSGSKPDPNNIVLILKTQSILFSRYSEDLQQYKYAGYKQLIKTIQLETDDDQLFSKTAPLLVAATEVTYHTVRCSALNAEELNRENGFAVLLGSYSRCVSVLSRSSKPDDIAVQVCSNCTKTFRVAAQFPECRNRFFGMPQLIADLARILHFKNLPKLCFEAAECMSCLAVDTRLQHALLRAGVLWHLLAFLFNYDYTLEECGVERSEEANNQELANNLAKMSVKACARLGGYHNTDESESPRNPVIQELFNRLFTPYLAQMFANEQPEELLKLLTVNSETPYLLWDNTTRAELNDFLDERRSMQPHEDSLDLISFEFSNYTSELIIGNVFIRLYNEQPTFPIQNGKGFVLDLLDYIKAHHPNPSQNNPSNPEELSRMMMALQALYNVIENNPGLEMQCIGHFGLLFPLLSLDSARPIQANVLNVLALITRNQECVKDIAASQMLVHLLLVIYSLDETARRTVSLNILRPLTTSTAIVKDLLAKGGYIYLLHVVCNAEAHSVRVEAAGLLGRVCCDSLSGPRVRLALAKFLPDAICDALDDAPIDSIRLLELDQENPELVWDTASRRHVFETVAALARRHYENQKINHNAQLKLPDKAIHSLEKKEIVVGGVYIRLFNNSPGWALRRPKDFLSALLDFALQLMSKDQLNIETVDMTVTALANLLQAQPQLADEVPALGHIPRVCAQIKATHYRPQIPLAIFRILYHLAKSEACIESLARTDVLKPMKLTMQKHTEVVGLGCETFVRLFLSKKDSLIEQALNADLVPYLLSMLDSRLEGAENTARCKALIVKALQSIAKSQEHGKAVTSLLEQSPVWASYRDQNHDLFISSSPSQNFLQGVPTRANYLTQGVTKTMPSVPPMMGRDDSR